MLLSGEIIRQVVRQLPRRSTPIPGYRQSAIMMLFFVEADTTHLVYIRRTRGIFLHSGQMAFPGGKVEQRDSSSRAAAERETQEEIGVTPDSYEYLGEMGFFETLTSRYDATAHVGWCSSKPVYKANRLEVDEVIEIPVRLLKNQFRPDLDCTNYQELMYLNFRFQPEDSEVANLWGLTARITHHFIQGLYSENHPANQQSSQ